MDESSWKPLETRLSVKDCTAFMYMGSDQDGVHRYKHIETGRYVNLDDKGGCHRHDGNGYVPADFTVEYNRATNFGRAINWGQVPESAFDRELDKAVQQPAPEPGAGKDR